MEASADVVTEKKRRFPKSIPFILILSLLERVSSIGSSCELKCLVKIGFKVKYFGTDGITLVSLD